METERLIYGNYERTASGMVYVEKTHDQVRANRINKIKCFLLSLIEEEFELSFRSQNCLNNTGIRLVGQLVQASASKLLSLKGFGRTSLEDIQGELIKRGLTLDMKLTFFPWDGTDEGKELIQILSAQKSGGGFCIDRKTAEYLDIDLTEINHSFKSKEPSISDTEYLLDRLETKFTTTVPYLTDLLKPHRQWLQKEMTQHF